LWPEVSEERGAANLRSALWRVREPLEALIVAEGGTLRLSKDVDVDLREASALARSIAAGAGAPRWGAEERRALSGDVLPDWYEDWVVLEQEHFRQLRLHALEALSGRLAAGGAFGAAVEAAQIAVAGESLRESAHRALICAHLAEGNRGLALRQLQTYRRVLWNELAVRPSPMLEGLIRSGCGESDRSSRRSSADGAMDPDPGSPGED
jgi:DNA-binding SARP family transcriptional activator